MGALLWAMDDPLYVHVTVDDGSATVIVEGVPLRVTAMIPTEGPVSLYVEGQPVHGATDPPWKEWVEAVARPFYWLDADAGWQAVWAFDQGDNLVWSHDFRREGLAGWDDPAGIWHRGWLGDATTAWAGYLTAPDRSWTRGRVAAILQPGQGSAGIALGGDGAQGTGLLVLVRPIHRDVIVWGLKDGVWLGPIGGAAWLRPWHSALKDLLRLILRPYFVALALGVMALALGQLSSAVLAVLPRRRRRLAPVAGGAVDAAAPVLASVEAARETDEAALGAAGAWPAAGKVERRWARAAAVAVAVLSGLVVLATGGIADQLLERMPHVQDSVAYLFQAKVFARGQLWAPVPALPEFFDHEFVVRTADRWFAKYTPGFPALLSLGVLAGVPWLVNPVASGLCIPVTFAIGRKVAGPGVGLIAALLLSLSPFFLILAGSHMAHTTGLLFILLFVLAYVELDRGSKLAAVLAGLALGVDLLIRPWTALLLAAPFGLDLLLRGVRQPRRVSVQAVLIALGLAPMLAIYFAYNLILTGDPLKSTMELWWSFDRLGFGPDKGILGHTPLNGLYNTVWNLSLLAVHTFGWPSIATFALALVPFALGRPTRWDVLMGSAWFLLMLGYFFWWADGVMYGPRFYHEATGFIALLTARGLAMVGQLGRAPARALSAVAVGALVAINLTLYLPVQLSSLHGYNYVSRVKIDAVERADVHDAVVFVDPGRTNEWWEYGMVFSANSPWLDTDVIYARDLGTANEHLMVHFSERRFYSLTGRSLIPIPPPDPR